MAICKDPSLTFLNASGYNVVRLPRVGIDPMDILGKDKSIERLGRVDQLWTSTQALPAINGPQAAAAISGQKSSDMKLSIGLKVLAGALGAMGAAVPDVTLAYSKAAKVNFVFTDVKSFSVDSLAIGQYLTAGDLASNNPVVRHYFDDEDCSAFIITEVLRSASITVTATTESGTEVSVDLPAMFELFATLAEGRPSVAVIANGGNITLTEV
ncbi:MAG: hypothetical protein ABI652_05160, partial [Acidobacteriota bacterium]